MRFKEEDLARMTAKPAAIAPPPVRTAPIPAAPPAAPVSAKARLQALGRLKTGEMNKTEQRFLDEWIAPRVERGEVKWWAFEAVTLKLAPDCRLTIDFFVMTADGSLQAWDVKGSFAIASDDFMVKARIAADKFPWPIFMTAPRSKKSGGGWEVKEF